MSKPLPKSLHTVTVIVRVSRLLQGCGYPSGEFTDEERVGMALGALGYDPENDPYGLAAAALKQLGA